MHRISIIGVGRVGGALAIALSAKGFEITELVYRGEQKPDAVAARLSTMPEIVRFGVEHGSDADVVLVTTGDPDIAAAAEWIRAVYKAPALVLHTSGSLSSEVLSNAAEPERIGSMHPLISISDSLRGAASFNGAYFCIEGGKDAVRAARNIVDELGGNAFTIETRLKPLYHAAAVVSCGHFVALEDAAIRMLSRTGLSTEDAKAVLLPLIRTTLENLSRQPPEDALTGSFARGDADAVVRHLAAIAENCDDKMMDVYLTLGELSLELAERRGIDPHSAEDIRKKMFLAKDGRKC